MKSKTSFSNLATFKKDLTRYAPIWGLYLIGLMLAMLEFGNYGKYDYLAYVTLPSLVQGFAVVNLIYAGICAVMLFGDLYNTRMCYSIHTIPQRREALFASHMASGLCFSIVPNTLAALYLMLQLENYWFLALAWLLAVTLQFIFFYGIAALAAMLTGNRFAMLLVYAGINFVSLLAYWVVDTIYLPQMTGVVLYDLPFLRLCPVVHLFSFAYFKFDTIATQVEYTNQYGEIITENAYFYEFAGLADGWGYLAVLAAVGLAAAVIALVLYRLRHLEAAGDFVAFPKLKIAACVIMTICVASVFALIGEEVIGDSMMLWLIVGFVIGFFGSLMLLERRIKVFRKKTFLGFAAMALVLTASFLAVHFDIFGVVSWTPKAEQVQSVTITNRRPSSGNMELFENDMLIGGSAMQATITDPDQIADLIEAHRLILEELDWQLTHSMELDSGHRITFAYKLSDGRTVLRSYYARAAGKSYETIRKYFYTTENILGFTDWERFVEKMEYICVDGMEIPQDQFERVLTALRTDCDNGAVNTDGGGALKLMIDLQWQENGYYRGRTLYLTEDAKYTLMQLSQPETLLGFASREEALADLDFFIIDDVHIDAHHWPDLVDALLADCENGDIQPGYYSHESAYHIYFSTKDCYRELWLSKEAENTVSWIKEHESLFLNAHSPAK